MICPYCTDGILEEPGEYRMKCVCLDGVAICECGDYATRVDDEGKALCDRDFFAWEREAAA